MDNLETTKQEILEAIQLFSSHVDDEFSDIKSEITGIKSEITGIKSEMTGIKSDVIGLKSEVSWIKSEMVTKDYFNEKLADLRGDLVVLVRKEDKKLAATLDLLVGKQLITRDEAAVVLALEPFPSSR